MCERAAHHSRSICCGCEKKQEQLLDIYHQDCQECVHSFAARGARYPVQFLGEKVLVDLYIAFNFSCTVHKAHMLFSYHKLSLF